MITKTLFVRDGRFRLLCAIAALLVFALWSAPDAEAQCREDRDCDGVLDTVDRCPDQPGPAANGGCPVKDPDSDGDGLPDSVDRCPREAGPRENGGCPLPPDPPPDPPPAPGGDTGDPGQVPPDPGSDQLPPDPDTPEEPGLLLPYMPEDGPCVVATQGTDGVNVRQLPGTSEGIFVFTSLNPELLYPVAMSFQTPEGLWWMLKQGGFVAEWVTRQGGDCAQLWTLYDGSVRFVSSGVSAGTWPASADSSPLPLAQVVSIGGQPVATIGGSEALTVGGSQMNIKPTEQISFVYEAIKWNSGDPDLPIILGSVPNSDDAAASDEFASPDCPLLPEIEGVTCQPGQPYMAWKLRNVRITSYSISGSGLDSPADIDALAVVNTPLFIIGDTRTIIAGESFYAEMSAPIWDLLLIGNGIEGESDTPAEETAVFDVVPYVGGVEFQDTWEQQTVAGDPPLVIGLPSAASGKGPSLLMGGGGDDILIGGTTTFDQTVHVLQLFALMDETGMFWFFDPNNTELPEGATVVHVGEIVVIGDEEVVVIVDQSTPYGWTISILPTIELKDWIELQSYQMGVQP